MDELGGAYPVDNGRLEVEILELLHDLGGVHQLLEAEVVVEAVGGHVARLCVTDHPAEVVLLRGLQLFVGGLLLPGVFL